MSEIVDLEDGFDAQEVLSGALLTDWSDDFFLPAAQADAFCRWWMAGRLRPNLIERYDRLVEVAKAAVIAYGSETEGEAIQYLGQVLSEVNT